MLAFDLVGGAAAARAFLPRLQLIALVPSLGDVTTTVSYPLAMSHRNVAPDDLAAMGVGDGLIRLSVGIEAVDDVIVDLAQALTGSGAQR
jgi:cystathionine beta-lyase/cystathionine gamma-synthase